jgi:hypothetical protein
MWSPVEIHLANYSCPNLALSDDRLDRKRRGYWRNQHRNSAVAAIASSMATGDLHTLWEFGLFQGRQFTASSLPFLKPQWLAVVVEGVEHAQQLNKLLPNYGLRRAFAPQQTSWQPLEIVTLAAIEEYDWFVPAVVINGVGGRFALDLPEDFAARPADDPAAIIELDDAFDDRAVKHTNRRLLEYGYRRWPVYPEHRLSFDPTAIPTRGRTAKTAYERRVEGWTRNEPNPAPDAPELPTKRREEDTDSTHPLNKATKQE